MIQCSWCKKEYITDAADGIKKLNEVCNGAKSSVYLPNGEYKEACDSCKHVLGELGVEDIDIC